MRGGDCFIVLLLEDTIYLSVFMIKSRISTHTNLLIVKKNLYSIYIKLLLYITMLLSYNLPMWVDELEVVPGEDAVVPGRGFWFRGVHDELGF